MSTPSSWPPPPPPGAQPQGFTKPQPTGPPQGYDQPQGYGQGYGQAVPYGAAATQPVPAGQPVPAPYGAQYGAPYGAPYGGPPVPPPAPRPERRLMPGVWWSLVLNLVVTVLFAVVVLLIGWAFVEMFAGFAGEDVRWQDVLDDEQVGSVVTVVALVALAALLVSWGLTVAALAIWRLMRGFRTIPPFLQALIAYVTMWVVTTVLSFIGQVVAGIAGVGAGSTGTY